MYTYVIRQLRGENGIVEKTLEQLKRDLEMEENDGLSPASMQRRQVSGSTLRQVGNHPNRTQQSSG